MIFSPFSSRPPLNEARLLLTFISLEDWALTSLTGEESEKYLQSQVTIDVTQIAKDQHLLAAHCDPKGKMWGNLRLFRTQNGFTLMSRRSVRPVHIAALRKYAVFSKVIIETDDTHVLLGVAGSKARDTLKKLFGSLPNADKPLLMPNGTTSLLWFEHPVERFLLVADPQTAQLVMKTSNPERQFRNSQQWLALNIAAGEAVFDLVNSGRFMPQETNLQALGGISFKKGCYTGQEMISRARFRGLNKRSLWYLSGYASRVPKAGEKLEIKTGQNWRYTGTILAAVQLEDKGLLVQAIINNCIQSDALFRVENDSRTLCIKPLPYSLEG